jgi:hypothetical protein
MVVKEVAVKRLAILFALLALGSALGACSKCGWVWDDWKNPARSCRGDMPLG